ncbi:hypothetical protein RYX36_023035 [Vicia faba]
MMAVERKTQGVGKKARVGAVGSKTEGVGKRVRVNWNVPYWKAFLIAIRGPNGKKKKKAAEIKYLARLKQQLSDKKNGLLPEVYIGYPKPKMMSRLSYH